MPPRLLLTIETTCDETAAAIVTEELVVLASVVASQQEIHERFGGVVPEIASRAHVERLLPVLDEAFRQAGAALADIDAIAVANQPGLAGSLLVGLTAAKSLALATGKPLIAINHLQAHVYACRLAAGREVFPCVGLIVSGGHSNLYRCTTATDFTPLGGTIDDAAGEAFDKVAALLGLPYPGGPSISRIAQQGNPQRHAFPRPLLGDPSRLDFSFSGLKTAVRYLVMGPGKLAPAAAATPMAPQQLADIAASFEAAVVDCLVGKSQLALQHTGFRRLCVGGGVAANQRLRAALQTMCDDGGADLVIPPPGLCTDNAVMGAIAFEHLRAGQLAGLDLDAHPGLERVAR